MSQDNVDLMEPHARVPPAWLQPPSSAIRAATILGAAPDDDADLIELERTQEALAMFDFAEKEQKLPPAPPSSPVGPFMKCSTCRGITLQLLSSENGYPHLSDWWYLEESAETCKLCNLIWEAREPGAGKTFHYDSPLTCTLHTTNDATILLVRSADYQFRSRLAFFLREDDPLSKLMISSRRWTLQNSSGKHLDIVNEGNEVESLTQIRLPLRRHLSTTDSIRSYLTAKAWIVNCANGHKSCNANETVLERQKGYTGSSHCMQQTPLTVSPLEGIRTPTRLIDLQFFGPEFPDAMLFPTEGQSLEYVTLSYCWGSTSSTRPYVTTVSSLTDGMRPLHYRDMPPTIQDAFRICRQLGFQYLWIDAICIVQDSKADWHREALSMASIYRNAHLTISADLSDSVELGCFNNRSISQTEDMGSIVSITNWSSESGRTSTLYFYKPTENSILEQIIESSPLSERGWCFQERALSRRVLHFTNYQLIWECQETYQAEDGLQIFRSQSGQATKSRTLCGLLRRDDDYARGGPDLLLLEWYKRIAEPYTWRMFTFWTDRLIALSGLAEEVGRRIGGAYLDGIWTLRLEFGLCWRRCGPHHDDDTTIGPGPSFSWAALIAPVIWVVNPHYRNQCKSLITLLSYENGISFVIGRDIAGSSSSEAPAARLQIRGRIRPVRVISDLVDGDEMSSSQLYDGDWLYDVLREREGSGGDPTVIGDVVFDGIDYVPGDAYCLPLHVDEVDEIYGLMIEKLPRTNNGEFPWRRIGLARVHTAPLSWRIGDMQTILLV